MVQREGVDRETAHWLCDRTDSERARFLHAIYGGRWDDPAAYDRVFSVTGQTVDQEVQAVIEALSARSATVEARAALLLRVVAARVKAGIATNPAFFLPVFDVLPDGAGLVLRGVTHTPKEHRRIEDAARALAGDVPLRCELHYRK